MNLDELRVEIDKIDDQLIKLFQERMDVAVKIGEYKKNNNIPVLNSQREREKLNDVANKANPEMKSYLRYIKRLIFLPINLLFYYHQNPYFYIGLILHEAFQHQLILVLHFQSIP